jgi:hypothetical protein
MLPGRFHDGQFAAQKLKNKGSATFGRPAFLGFILVYHNAAPCVMSTTSMA